MQLFKKPDTFICEIVELKTLAEKSKGLIGAERPFAVYFKTCLGIHTFGVKFPIDVVIADGALRVQKIKKSLPPGSVFFWNPAWQNIFELPPGTVITAALQTGDALELRS